MKWKWGLTAAAGALGAAPFALGAAYQAVRTRRDDREWPGLGERIEVDGRLVHVRRLGEQNDGPTVLFESGLSSPLEMWSWVQCAVADAAPTISYDRAGVGWSQPAARPRTAARITDELERTLATLGVTGPLVLVGHSYGGMLLREFVRRHPERIAGVVLVDSAHPEQLRRSARQRLGLPLMRATISSGVVRARFGLARLAKVSGETQLSGLGEVEGATTLARTRRTGNWLASQAEVDAWLSHVVDEVKDTTVPAGLPLYVLTAGDTENADPVHGELQRELATLSAGSVHQVLPGATHLGLLCSAESAAEVAAAVLEVVNAAREGRAPKLVEPEAIGSQS
jgi:pimeloyl-ACP methyl ester carboxylesterase